MLENIKSVFFIKILFYNLTPLTQLKILKYNKSLQNKIDITLMNYKLLSERYIVQEENGKTKEFSLFDNQLLFEGEYLNGKRNGKGKEYLLSGRFGYIDMIFEGESNWLIVIAPYFFPLICFLYMIFVSIWSLFMPTNFIITIIFGYLVGLHIDTVVSQIHEKQTDLPKVSYSFCLLFLPGANFLTLGSLLAFNSLEWVGIKMYFLLINNLTLQYITDSINIVLNL